MICMTRTLLLMAFLAGSLLPLAAQEAMPVDAKVGTSATSIPVAHALEISSGDLLDVAVFDTPELSTKIRVDERGEITLPLTGVIPVSGLTAEQAGVAIESRLRGANILKQPHVSVTVDQYSTQGITVLGEIRNPGVYPLLGAHGLLDIVSAAGGLTPNAGKAITVTHRSEPDKPVIIELNSRPGSSAAFNVDLRPGDTVMVSHSGIVYVVGDVGRAGGFVIENNDRLTVLQAIALAQGPNKTASLNNTKIIRKTGDQRELLPIPIKKIMANKAPDPMLNDGDILFVPSSAAKNAMVSMENLLPSVASAAIFRVP
jgi:polysaccharide export outer membrane protein